MRVKRKNVVKIEGKVELSFERNLGLRVRIFLRLGCEGLKKLKHSQMHELQKQKRQCSVEKSLTPIYVITFL